MRRSARPSRGVACFDCHTNGHTNAATHLAGDARPPDSETSRVGPEISIADGAARSAVTASFQRDEPRHQIEQLLLGVRLPEARRHEARGELRVGDNLRMRVRDRFLLADEIDQHEPLRGIGLDRATVALAVGGLDDVRTYLRNRA